MSTPIMFDLQDVLVKDCSDYFVKERDTPHTVKLATEEDGTPRLVTMPGSWLAFNALFWRPLLRRGMPIRPDRHMFWDEDLTTDVMVRIHTNILWDMIMTHPGDVEKLKFEMIETVEDIYNFIISKLNRFVYTVDMFSVAETLTTPGAKEVCHIDVRDQIRKGIKSVEDLFKQQYQKINKYFLDPNVKPNVFFPALKLGILNKTQFPQLVGGVGTRTDTDDSMILLPIRNSFIQGLDDIRAYAIESLAAKKSVHYNAEEMPFTQYTNRKQQLNSSAISRVYAGDCGTDVTVKFRLHKNFAPMVFGKYIKHDGQIVALTQDNYEQFADKDIEMYSIMSCRYTDGFCHKCGGMLAQYFLPPTVIPGIIAGSEVMSPLAQQVLSNKHMTTTFATGYVIPEELKGWLRSADNDIFFTEQAPIEHLMVGVKYEDVMKLADLDEVEGEIRDDKYFSSLSMMLVANAETGEIILPTIELEDKYKSKPYFAAEFLEVLRRHPEDIVPTPDGSMVWIKLRHFDTTRPFMRAVVFNYSTKIFVSKIQSIFTSKIVDMTSITEYLETITNAIWVRISPNILHLEVMGKASMITSPTDFRIPVVTDPDQVMFGRLDQLIPRRSIGTQFAFEQLVMYISSPSTYLMPKTTGPFDDLLGFSD